MAVEMANLANDRRWAAPVGRRRRWPSSIAFEDMLAEDPGMSGNRPSHRGKAGEDGIWRIH